MFVDPLALTDDMMTAGKFNFNSGGYFLIHAHLHNALVLQHDDVFSYICY